MLLMQPKLSLHQHAGFLLHGVGPGEYDLEPFAVHFADRRFPDKHDSHPKPLSVAVIPSYRLGVKNQ
jgi:hypothetical protein